MDVKEQTKKAYELFGSGDMETFFNDMIDDEIVWTFPGKEGVHPLSGVHKGKQAMMAAMSKIPATWPNFHLKVLDMISEGNKVFARVPAIYNADGFFEETTYIGAVSGVTDNWYKGWTVPGSIKLN